MTYKTAPVQIARDDAARRIVVGVNTRGIDQESFVKKAKQLIREKVDLPAGYYVEYGGQFEHLKEAQDRLSTAVPVALALILVLLFFTFGSIKYVVLIFVTVPLSSVGGVAALWLRGMPFSISAGIGFIALLELQY